MASPSLLPGQYNTNLKLAVEKEGGFAAIGLTSSVLKSIMTQADFMSLFPIGAVMMWLDEATIPTGWAIIPGSAGLTPLGLATGGTSLVASGSATSPVSAHSVTQPANHSPAATGAPSATIGSIPDTGVNVAAHQTHTHQSPTLTHTATAVAAHTAITVAPPAFSIFFIEKVS